jgi:hypothetical protein
MANLISIAVPLYHTRLYRWHWGTQSLHCRYAAEAACCLRGGGIVMHDNRKYPQGAIWNWLLDGVLTIALIVPVVALVLFLI